MDFLGRSITRFALLILATFRTIYCWIFLLMSFGAMSAVYENVRSLMHTHVVIFGDIVSNVSLVVFSIIWGIAWWMILRGKPVSKQWAIAANLIFIFIYLPGIITGNWRAVWEAELGWWPFILFGIFGIIVYSIPYRGWRANRSVTSAQQAG